VETWDAITSRRNVREFSDRPLPPGSLDRILEAGRRSPSSRNWQPWDFVAVTSRDRLGQLAGVWRAAGHVAHSAATIALIAPVTEDGRQHDQCQYDLGQATMSILLAAADLGIGSAHAAVENQQLARQLLGFPEGRYCAYLIALGYPAGRPLRPIAKPDRRPLADVAHHEHW
jgi:nitroreductase